MLKKTLITFGIGMAIAVSPLRDSKFVEILIQITGG